MGGWKQSSVKFRALQTNVVELVIKKNDTHKKRREKCDL